MTSPAMGSLMIKLAWKCRLALIVPIVAVSAGLVATPSAAAAQDPASARQAVTLINQERARAGCASLRVLPKLQTPAGQQSRDQAARDRFGHDGAHGSTVDSRLSGLGYSRWGENVAQAQSAQAAVNWAEELAIIVAKHHHLSTYRGPHAELAEAFRRADLNDLSQGVIAPGCHASMCARCASRSM
ncbi:MAG: CAP domain-containing protein [Pseudonocardiaceae bacterium]